MLDGGAFGLFLIGLFTAKGTAFRVKALRTVGLWILTWTPFATLGAINYYRAMPEAMTANMSTAVGTMDFEEYYHLLKWFILGAITLSVLIALYAVVLPRRLRTWMIVVPMISVFGFLGIFERVREFIRKPYIIGGYMYSNLLREEDYPIYQRDGILAHTTYRVGSDGNPDDPVAMGRDVFMLTCSRCHTAGDGVNSIVEVFERMYGKGVPFDYGSVKGYIPNMHNGRTYMPPYPGNAEELDALATYILHLQSAGEPLQGAQAVGVGVDPEQTQEAFAKRMRQARQDSPTLVNR